MIYIKVDFAGKFLKYFQKVFLFFLVNPIGVEPIISKSVASRLIQFGHGSINILYRNL